MAAFHVFVEGATDESPGGLERLAGAIATHYGLGAADLLARLQKGRFRVKGNTDRTTADTYARDLVRLGARSIVEEATADNSQRTTPLPFPAVRPETPPAGTPTVSAARASTPPPMGLAAAGPRASTSPTMGDVPSSGLAAAGPRASTPLPIASALDAAGPRASTPPPIGSALADVPRASTTPPPMGSAGRPSTPPPIAGGPQFQSGLSAAFSGEMPAADLGALGGSGGDAAFSLASLDGVEDNSASGGSIGPPPSAGGLPASIGPAPEKPKSTKIAKADKPKDEPLDMFAPPEMQGDEFKVDIASDEADFSARKRASTPPPMETVPDPSAAKGASQRISKPSLQVPNAPTQRLSKPSLQVPNAPVSVVTTVPSKLGPLADERVRFVAGVILAVVLGFIPAHFIAKMKEESAYATIDNKVIVAQQAAETPEVYANLDRMRADQLDRKESEHRNAALIGFAIWALAGGGIAFAWFKKIPWDA